MIVTVLGVGDERRLDAFLRDHADSSMFLRSNVRAAGLVDRGDVLQGTYAAALSGDRIVGVACHTWRGVLVLQAPAALDAVVRAAVGRSRRPVHGVIGPWTQVVAARDVLGFGARSTRHESREILYALDLAELIVPDLLASGGVSCRRPSDGELPRIAEWRVAYNTETFAGDDGPDALVDARREVAWLHAANAHFLLEHAGTPVAYATFNARVPDMVQVGGVFTPPALRSRGYARCVVAGSLLEARGAGAQRATLFTAEDNWPARRAYEALGFDAIGDYGLMFFTARRSG